MCLAILHLPPSQLSLFRFYFTHLFWIVRFSGAFSSTSAQNARHSQQIKTPKHKTLEGIQKILWLLLFFFFSRSISHFPSLQKRWKIRVPTAHTTPHRTITNVKLLHAYYISPFFSLVSAKTVLCAHQIEEYLCFCVRFKRCKFAYLCTTRNLARGLSLCERWFYGKWNWNDFEVKFGDKNVSIALKLEVPKFHLNSEYLWAVFKICTNELNFLLIERRIGFNKVISS